MLCFGNPDTALGAIVGMSSLKPDLQLLRDTSSIRAFLPVGDLSLDNCRDAFQRALVGLFVLNSVLVTGLTVILWPLIVAQQETYRPALDGLQYFFCNSTLLWGGPRAI